MDTKPGRIPCEVPGCGRTAAQEKYGADAKIICGPHWRLADKRMRQLRSKVRRKGNRYGWTVALIRLDDSLWNRCRAQAIERAMGI